MALNEYYEILHLYLNKTKQIKMYLINWKIYVSFFFVLTPVEIIVYNLRYYF